MTRCRVWPPAGWQALRTQRAPRLVELTVSDASLYLTGEIVDVRGGYFLLA